MNLRGSIENIYKDFKTNKWNLLISLNMCPSEMINDLLAQDLDISLKKHSKPRSLDANAYFYHLINKIAVKENLSDTEVHDKLLSENLCYILENEAIDWMVSDRKSNNYRLLRVGKDYYYDSLQDVVLGKPDGSYYATKGKPKVSRIYWHVKGSHQMNTKEMSRLINSTVEEAKGLGIETLTPKELAILESKWGNKKQNSV